MDEIARTFPAPPLGAGGVRPNILGRSQGPIGRPGPLTPGLTRFAPPSVLGTKVTALQYTVLSSTGSFVLTGVSANRVWNHVVTATTRAFTLTGIDARLRYPYIPATTTTYVLTGIAAGLRLSNTRMAAGTGTYIVTGVAASVRVARVVHGTSQTYVWTGVAANLVHNKPIAAAVATYVWTGVAATLRATRLLSAVTKAFVLSGKAAKLEWGHRLFATLAGVFTWTGVAASFVRGRGLAADVASYVETGKDANLVHANRLPADSQPYALTGLDVGMTATRTMPAAATSYATTGIAAGLDVGRYLGANLASYVMTGMDAAFGMARTTPAATTSYSVTGIAVGMIRIHNPLLANTATYALAGVDNVLRHSIVFPVTSQPYTLSASPAALLKGSRLYAAGTVAANNLWTPDLLSTPMSSWLKADSLTLNDLDSVATWTDASGHGASPAQASPTNQPKYRTGIQNGLPVVRFDGVNDSLACTFAATLNQPNTVFVVAKGGRDQIVLDGVVSPTFLRHQCYITTSGNPRFYAGSPVAIGTVDITNLWSLWSAVFNGASSIGLINGGSQVSANFGTQGLGGLTLGMNGSTGNYLNGDIGEVLVFNAVLSTADRQQVEGYLAWKWGIQASLPGNHPYSAGAPTLAPPPAPAIYTLTGYGAGFAAPRLLVATTGLYVLRGKNVGLALGNGQGHTLGGSIVIRPRLRGSISTAPRLSGKIVIRPRLRGAITIRGQSNA